jgi:flagellar protein FlaJ
LKAFFNRWHRWLAYVSLGIIAVLCFIFSSIAFSIPLEKFVSSTQAFYDRLFAAILLGAGVSLALLIALDIFSVQLRKCVGNLFSSAPIKLRLKPLSETQTIAFISKYDRLQKFAERTSQSLAKDVIKANENLSPYKLAAKSLFYTIITFFICTPSAVILAIAVNPILLVIVLVPLVPLVYPHLKLRSATGDRKRAVDDELPFFAMYADILQSVGVNLYDALQQSIGKGVFKQIEKDALMVKRNVEFFFRSPVEALEEVGKMHPNDKMKTLLLGYTSEWRSGGDLIKYLEAKADDSLKDMSFKWKNYAEHASDIGETIVSLLFVLPLMILMSAFIFPSQALTLVAIVSSTAVPLVTVGVFGWLNAQQPKTYDNLTGNLKLSLLAGAIALPSTALLGIPLWLCIAVTLAAASTFYGASIFLQLRENRMLEKALPQFLRDITEYRKMGYDITQAILKISDENTYNAAFDGLLRAVARQMKLGLRMAEVDVPTRSWLTKMSFFLLTQITESGGGTPSSMEKLMDFINQVVRTKRETAQGMRLYQVLSIFTPIGLSLITALMFTLMTAFASAVAPGSTAGLIGSIAQIPQGLIDMSYLLVLTSSTCIALLTTKTVELTAKNTLWITVNMALAAGSIALSVQLATLLLSAFNGF